MALRLQAAAGNSSPFSFCPPSLFCPYFSLLFCLCFLRRLPSKPFPPPPSISDKALLNYAASLTVTITTARSSVYICVLEPGGLWAEGKKLSVHMHKHNVCDVPMSWRVLTL